MQPNTGQIVFETIVTRFIRTGPGSRGAAPRRAVGRSEPVDPGRAARGRRRRPEGPRAARGWESRKPPLLVSR